MLAVPILRKTSIGPDNGELQYGYEVRQEI
jgi:hypothetical protein